ncbi:methyltransferase domain-containing protein [Pseudarcicella sp. GAP-15]|nr:methyltransferase domain-containing protein [Pseudarcicella sp. GAP-15]
MEDKKMICKVCGSDKHKLKFEHVSDINFNMTNRLYNWYSCSDCDTFQILPIDFKKEELSEYYEEYDPHSHKLKLVSRFSNSPISLVINHIKSLKNLNDEFSVLDIGCGDGNLLYNLRNSFPKSILYGIDYNIASSSYNLVDSNVNLFQGNLVDFKFEIQFDFICNSQLLEHLDEPEDLFNLLKSTLKVDGIGFLDIPNADSKSFKLFGKNWVHLDTPRHRILYKTNSLNKILEKYNFQKIRIQYFGTGFAYLSSFLLFVKEKKLFTMKLPFKIQWVISKCIQLFLKSDDKIFLVFKHK